ncbi:MAG: tyrosine-type recombinase/integrase, partial [Acidobacteria bacterium]|nr:tyrosine-type recombinase/integrase [Acidobacteriota bacterium]
MLRLLFYTAVRVSELASIRVDAVDLDAGKVFIERGKGDKDRYILFPRASGWPSRRTWPRTPTTSTCSSPVTAGPTALAASSRSYRSTRRRPASPSTSTRTCSGTRCSRGSRPRACPTRPSSSSAAT